MQTDNQEIFHLATQLQRINYLGHVQTFQIEFDYLDDDKKVKLSEVFTDSLDIGQFKSDLIVIEQVGDRDLLKIVETFHNIQKITGDLSLIESITTLVEINYKNDTHFIVVSFIPPDSLELISTSESTLYFELLNYVRTKWAFSKTFIK
ncbi:MAG: hypothetical protein ACTSQE_08080 [Candidatus Heimdallarchaeaceae archaeon]